MNGKRILAFFLSASLLWAGCSNQPEYTGITKQAATKFASMLEASISKGQWKTLENLMSKEAFAQQIAFCAHADVPDTDMRKLAESLTLADIGHELVEQMKDFGHYKFLNTYEKEGQRHILFRFYAAQGLNYHDFLLCKKGDEILVADCFVFLSGEPLSETLWQESKFLRGEADKRNDHKTYYQQLKTSMRKYIKKGDFENALDAYQKMPTSVQNTKVNLQMAIGAAKNLNDTALSRKLYETYKRQHHTTTDIHFLTLDHAFVQGDYDQVLQAIDSIDSLVGGDGWLSYYRGIIYMQEDDIENAEKQFIRTLQYDTSFGETYYWLTVVEARKGNDESAKKYLQQYRRSNEFDGKSEQELIEAFPQLDAR